MVEHRLHTAGVAGSSPVSPTQTFSPWLGIAWPGWLVDTIRIMKSFGGYRISQRLLALLFSLSVLAGLGVGVATPANAQSGFLPRYLPTAVPAGYQMRGASEGGGDDSDQYVHILRDGSGTKEFVVSGVPASKERSEFLIPLLVGESTKKVTVHGRPGRKGTLNGNAVVAWFERGRVISVTAAGSTPKAVVVFAAGVLPTKKGDGSFTIEKKPVGFTTLFAGPASSIISTSYSVAWQSEDGLLIQAAANVVANYVDLISGPTSRSTPVTIGTKPGFAIQREGVVGVVWMEQPNLVIQIVSTELNVEGVLAVASSVAPLDEAAFQSATEAVDEPSADGGNGATPAPVSGPVAAGNIAGAPWVATISAQCVRFALSKVKVETCLPGFTSPSALISNIALVNGKPVAVGVTGANVATVVFTVGGAEVARIATSPILDQPGIRYFVVELPTDTAVSASGLDAAGLEIAPATLIKKA